jgi:hypothetical protein
MPDLPERAEQVRAALNGEDRARFDGELDQALEAARQTRDLKPLGHVVEAWWRLVLLRRHGGAAWAQTEAQLRAGHTPPAELAPVEVEELIARQLG